MKHTAVVTMLLVAFFVVAQLVGLGLIALATPPAGPPTVSTGQAAQGASVLVIGVLIGTIVLLALIRFRLYKVWKLWFFLAVWLSMTYSLNVIMPWIVAIILSLGLTAWKIFKPNLIVHNVTEILVYAGIAVIIAQGLPLTVPIAAGVLVLIAVYDMYAVWRSKHMVRMAEFQTQSQLFAGLLVPYDKKQKKVRLTGAPPPVSSKPRKSESGRTAVLGGGDIAFPLIFMSAVLQDLIRNGYSKLAALGLSGVIVVFATLSLIGLFVFAKEDRFYPAMPFLGAGCFVGYAALFGLLALGL